MGNHPISIAPVRKEYEGSEKKQSGQRLQMMLKAIEVEKVEGGGGGVFA